RSFRSDRPRRARDTADIFHHQTSGSNDVRRTGPLGSGTSVEGAGRTQAAEPCSRALPHRLFLRLLLAQRRITNTAANTLAASRASVQRPASTHGDKTETLTNERPLRGPLPEILDLKLAGITWWTWCAVIGITWLLYRMYLAWHEAKERKEQV